MSILKVTVLQQPLIWMDPIANRRHFDRLLDTISDSDLAILPEMFTTGFCMDAAQYSEPELTVIDWPYQHARRKNMLIGGSIALKTETSAVNRFIFVSPQGDVTRYDKRHLFRMGQEHLHFKPGTERVILQWWGFRILPQICYDLRFPVFSRNQNDYDLLIYTASWPASRRMHWQTLLAARVIENQCYVIGCNHVGDDPNGLEYSGDSQILSAQGEIIVSQGSGIASILTATLSLQEISQYRHCFPAWQDADNLPLYNKSPVS